MARGAETGDGADWLSEDWRGSRLQRDSSTPTLRCGMPSREQRRSEAFERLFQEGKPPPGRISQLEAQRLLLTGRIFVQGHAVGLHARRVLLDDEDTDALSRNADAVALAYSVRDLLREAELAVELGVPGAEDARRGFEVAVPRSKDMRDVLAHLDEYVLGIGDLQRRDGLPLIAAAGFYARDSSGGYTLMLAPGLELSVVAARDAAAELMTQLLDALLEDER